MPVEQVVRSVCNYKQAYTQFGGLRPFGTAFLFAGDIIPYECDALMMMMLPLPVSLMMMIPHCVGYDSKFGFQLYQTDPSGNYSGWKATVIGNSEALLQRLYSTDSLLVGAPSFIPVCTILQVRTTRLARAS